MSGPIRSALMTAKSIGGRLELDRAKEAKKRAPGQVSPSKHMPGVPRQVRAEGGPLRLYHGTEHSHPIDELDPFISPDQLGVHLGDAPTANRFATRMTYDPNSGFTRSPRVIPFNAKIQNPLRLHDKHGTWDPSIVYKQLVEKGLEKHSPQIEERLANLENGDGPTGDSVMDHGKALKYQKQAVQEVHDMIRKHGYDGVVYLNRHEMPTDEAKARMEDVKRPGYIMRGQLNKMTDDQFRKHFPEATDSYIAFDPEQLESPFGKGTGVGYADGGEVDDQNQQEPVGIIAYHGSPHDFDEFRWDATTRGTGEGAQAYGDGLYFAGNEDVAKGYRDALKHKGVLDLEGEAYSMGLPLSREAQIELRRQAAVDKNDPMRAAKWLQSASAQTRDMPQERLAELIDRYRNSQKGHMYEVHIAAHPDHFLDWDKPLSEQPALRKILTEKLGFKPSGWPYDGYLSGRQSMLRPDAGGDEIYRALGKERAVGTNPFPSKEAATEILREAGIPGIKYLDAGSRGHTDKPTRNYVVFDDKLVNIRRKYARGGSIGRAGAHPALQIPGVHVREEEHGTPTFMNRKTKAEGGTVDEQKNEAPAARLGDVTQAGGFPLAGGIRGGEGVLPASLPAHGEVDLTGLPTNIKIPKLGMSIVAAHNPVIRQAARDYARAAGIDYNPPTSYQQVDPERATRIAHAYENMAHIPDHPLVKASYEALKQETLAQYQAAKAAGLKAEFYPDPTKDPYRSQPRLMSEDVNKNNHMYVYPTDAGFGTGEQPEGHENNPMLADSGERWNGKPVAFNDLFRAVHDYYGHVKEGLGFRGDGEENAWRSHSAMYSPLARIAMGAETRGQNSLLNYGPNGERNRNASTDDTFFSPQKLGVLPVWAHHEGAEFIKPEERAQMEEIYKNFGVDPDGVVGPDIRKPMSIFPKPQRMFPEDARPPGGQYLAMPDRRDVTGHKAEAATIGVQPGGKPFFNASQNAVEQTGSTGRGTAMARANLFKQKAGWKWLNAPEEHASTDTIVSVEHRGKHHYALNAHFPRGVDLARYENSPTEPRLRPTTTGNVQLGPQAGSILVRGKEHPVYRHVIVKETGGLVAPQYENPVKLAKKALMAAKKTGSRS